MKDKYDTSGTKAIISEGYLDAKIQEYIQKSDEELQRIDREGALKQVDGTYDRLLVARTLELTGRFKQWGYETFENYVDEHLGISLAMYSRNLCIGKSRTAMIVLRGRGKNELGEAEVGKRFWKEFKNGVPKRYANKYALYVRPRASVERIKTLAHMVNRFSDGDSSGIKDVTKIIRDLKRLGYSKNKIVKTLGIQESEVK